MTRIDRLRQTGIRRVGSPKRGFRYRNANGRPAGAKDLARIRSLVLPPAWKDVTISASPTAFLQAVGRDAAGRWQYRYSDAHVRRRETEKFRRIVEFAAALPKMRAAVARDLALPGYPREKVLACILRILSTCFLRPGSQVYAAENGSFGIATLRNRHVHVERDVVRYDFPGKSGKRQTTEMRDRVSAAMIRKLKKMPGVEVFKYVGSDGKVVDVKRRDINRYIQDVMGAAFTAKDFRTWYGTLVCARELARAGAERSESKPSRRRKITEAVRKTAERLGNTPSVCRASYIYPSVIRSFERGHTIDRHLAPVEKLAAGRRGLRQAERALLRLLKKKAA